MRVGMADKGFASLPAEAVLLESLPGVRFLMGFAKLPLSQSHSYS
jgi:hypothetical protein